MKTLDEIKEMMAAGDTAQADAALKELLAAEPGNLQAKMLYGTCCQLLGDEETFKRIHDELAPEMERMERKDPKVEAVSLWKKYHTLWEYMIVAGLVLAGLTAAVAYLGSGLKEQMRSAYRGPMMDAIKVRHDSPAVRNLYVGPPRSELEIDSRSKKFSDDGMESN